MRKGIIPTLVMMLCCGAALPAEDNCGEYTVTGRPSYAPDGSPLKQGLLLFEGTSNERFLEIEGLKMLRRRSPLGADYTIKVRVTKTFGRIPAAAKFIALIGPATSVQKSREGFRRISKEACSE